MCLRAEEPFDAREVRSEEHTSELQSQSNLVCRLLLEKKTDFERSHRERDLGAERVAVFAPRGARERSWHRGSILACTDGTLPPAPPPCACAPYCDVSA